MVQRVAVVILNYKNIEETLRCIEEFKNQTEDIKIIVVDNDSQDESHDILSRRSDIMYIQTNENLGYARGNNIGIDFAIKTVKVDNIIISNNDIYLPNENTIKDLINLIQTLPLNWGYLGTTIKNSDGTLAQYSPQKHTTLVNRIVNSTLIGIPFRKFYNKKSNTFKNQQIFESEIVSGAFFVLNSKVVEEIGAFDPYTFLYGEERILAKKYYNNGYKGFITRTIEVEHDNSSTTKRYPSISYINNLKSEYYYFVKYKSISKLKKLSLVFIRIIDTMLRVTIGNIHMKTLLETINMYNKVRKEIK